jgi:hypothetical protein
LDIRSWHLEKSSLLCFSSDMYFFKEIIHIKNYFANIATITGMTTTTCTWLTKGHVLFRHFKSENQKLYMYKVIDIYIVTHLGLLE